LFCTRIVPFKSSGLYTTDYSSKMFGESSGLFDGEDDLKEEDLSV
jgi:hypothetical protein